MLVASDQDIEFSERLLLPAGKVFNDERRAFIKCMDSRDVVACPGSGKTTALLAKLLILASKMPFDDGRGICVLTHTNIAIDEIKRKAGSVADSLFQHPNYFGTIQSFVNRFLAIPSYRCEFGKPIHSIENETYYSAFSKRYSRTQKAQYRIVNLGWDEGRIAYLPLSPEDLSVKQALIENIPRLGETEQSFGEIVSIRKELLENGILSYDDAYPLAVRYLNRHPQIVEAFHSRFAFCFIDEMQDTDIQQLDVLNTMFSNEKVILQRLGDRNQAIFHSMVQKDMYWHPAGNPPLPFSDSLRYGASIARLLGTVRIDNSISLLPNLEQHSLSPYMLLFDEGEDEQVLAAFGRLIKETGIHEYPKAIFKAIGWVGKDNREDNKLCIPSYLTSFAKAPAKKRKRFESLLGYLTAARASSDDGCSSHYHDNIMRGMVHAISMAQHKNPETDRYFTAASFKTYLKSLGEDKYSALMEVISCCTLEMHNGRLPPKIGRDKVAAMLKVIYPDTQTAGWNNFLASDELENMISEQIPSGNYFDHAEDIQIEVATVHSVKGETHTATLYLETSYYGTDGKRLLPFLTGKYPSQALNKTRHIENLKMAHVAFSRPTHLLAFACLASEIDGHEDELAGNGWIIKRVNDSVKEQHK